MRWWGAKLMSGEQIPAKSDNVGIKFGKRINKEC